LNGRNKRIIIFRILTNVGFLPFIWRGVGIHSDVTISQSYFSLLSKDLPAVTKWYLFRSEELEKMLNSKKHSFTSKKFLSTLSASLAVGFGYTLMKIFGRIYFLKRVYIFFSRIPAQQEHGFYDDTSTNVSVQLLDGAEVNDVVRDIKALGYSTKIRLNDFCIESILQYANNERCYAYGDPNLGFYLSEKINCEKVIGKEILAAKYLDFQGKSAFDDFIKSPVLDAIAKGYLGSGAQNIGTQLWWNYPADVDVATRSKAALFFHRDVDAWGFVKFFFYLSDVGLGGGPHVYVEASHKPSTLSQILSERLRINRHSDASIRNRFGDASVKSFYGTAGAGIAADTFGFHKGESPEINPRLMLCAVYATKDYGLQDFVSNEITPSAYDA